MTVFRTERQSMIKGHCVAPAKPLKEEADMCTCQAERRMTKEELEHIERNLQNGYRWGCEMAALVRELKYHIK